MQDLTVICGQCGAEVAVTESLAAPLIEASKKEFERKLAEKNRELREQADEMDRRRAVLESAEASLDDTIRQKVKVASASLAAEAEKKVRAEMHDDLVRKATALEDAETLIKTRTEALRELSETASSLKQEKAALEEENLRLESTVEDKVGDAVRQARTRYQSELQGELEKKDLEKTQEIAKAKAVEAAARKLELAELKKELETIAQEDLLKKQEAAHKLLEKQKNELLEVKQTLAQRDADLTAAKVSEAEFLKMKRQLDDEKRQMPLTIQQKVDEELATSREALKIEMDREVKLQLRAKDTVLESMKAEIENLKRKSEQGSQQVQGEAWEREVSDILAFKFPLDKFRRVAKGESGADIVHEVYNAQGRLCGSLLWESKRTKTWNDDWLGKLKSDQRKIKADTAVIVSHALPKDMTTFDNREDVWVTGPDCLIAVAGALRHLLIEVASTKRSNEGHKEKAALVYDYVTSVPFRARVKALVETYSAMQTDLKNERKAIMRQWAKRETQLELMIEATGGMYGDLQGIAGQSVPELEGLGFGALEAGE